MKSEGDVSSRHVSSKLSEQPLDELSMQVVELSHRLATGTYELLVLIGELDARGSYRAYGALTCAAWLAEVCEIEICTARSQVRVARAMRKYPDLNAAMRSGDISYAKARVLVPYLTRINVDDLLAIAARNPASRLGAAIAAWSNRNEDQDLIAARQFEARSVTSRVEPDGMVVITARLTPAAAGAILAVIDAKVARSNAPAGASLAQQSADALLSAVVDGSGSVEAELVIHVRPDGNSMSDGTPLADNTVAALLPGSFVSLLIHDSKRRPIDASPRRRFPTRRQRRVIDEIDQECRSPGCHSTKFLQYDHIQPYSKGGTTVIANLQKLCGPHNRGRHQP